MNWRCILPLLTLLQASAAWTGRHYLRHGTLALRRTAGPIHAAVRMCEGDEDFQCSLQSSLKRAAVKNLGTSIESAMVPEDLAWYRAGSNSMAAALQEAKERLTKRKAEVGGEAALRELDRSIRDTEARAAARPLLKARPRLWLLDRDGCINEDIGAPGVLHTADLRLIPGSAGALRRLRLSGKVAVVTNQSARGKGLLSAADLDAVHEELRHQLAKTARGGRSGHEQWDALYVCEDASSSHRRKPEPGMILEALRDFDCAASEAVMIGDSWSDVVSAQRAGCVGVLLATGHGASLGAILQEEGVHLPVTLTAPDAPVTEFVALQQSLQCAHASGVGRAIEKWICGRSKAEAALVWEALRTDVRVYADLSEAVDELAAIASGV